MDFKESKPLYKLAEVAEKLRAEDGCPWDREQTSMSMRKYLIEETYELIDAIEKGNTNDIIEELGDLLYQVYAHSQIAKEENRFNIDDVAERITKKLIHRHPHVFSNEKAETSEDVLNKWEKIKKKEKAADRSVLDGIPPHLPALLKAERIQEKASRVGFDWETVDGPIEKLQEEIDELKEAVSSGNRTSIEEEFGDLLFTVVNVSRFLKVSCEESLQSTNNKFMKRFRMMEKTIHDENKNFHDYNLTELDLLWEKTK